MHSAGFLSLFRSLVDTKTLQKEINHMSGKLDRTFTVNDELIFKVTKSLNYLSYTWSLIDWLFNPVISSLFLKKTLTK